MKKHIIGLAVFSFIVSAAAIVYTVFNVPKITEIPSDYYHDVSIYKTPTTERSKLKPQIIKQAVFDLRLKIVHITLNSNELYENDYQNKTVRFDFFTKNAEGVKFIASEKETYIPQSKFYGEEFDKLISLQCNWLRRLNSRDNLYVIAKVSSDTFNSEESPVFDSQSATPVTLFSEKNSEKKINFQH